MVYKAFEPNLVTMYPITGEKIMLRKNDHCTPIFLFLPIVSEIINERTYQAMNMVMIMYSFIILVYWYYIESGPSPHAPWSMPLSKNK